MRTVLGAQSERVAMPAAIKPPTINPADARSTPIAPARYIRLLSTLKQRRMERETFCEAPPVARSARSVLSHVSTHRSERWRIAGCIALQAMLFSSAVQLGEELSRAREPV
jgi:hypothetical protein